MFELSFGVHGTDPAPCSTSGVTAGLLKLTTEGQLQCRGRGFTGATITEACDGSDDIFGLSTDSLSRLRSPSVLEVEKGYERLKEELAAQRVSKNIFYSSICYIENEYLSMGATQVKL